MDKQYRQQQMKQDSEALGPALTGLVTGVSLPEALKPEALRQRLTAPPQAGLPAIRPPLSRRVGRWVRPAAAAAAVFAVCIGSLLAFRRQELFPSLARAGGSNDMAAPQSMAAAMPDKEDAAEPEAEAAPADGAAEGEMLQAPAGAPAPAAETGREAAQKSVTTQTEPEAAEDTLYGRSAPEIAQPTAAFGGAGIAQIELQEGEAGGSAAWDERYLYYLAPPTGEQEASLYIVEAQGLQVTASVPAGTNAQAVLVAGDRLALVSEEITYQEYPQAGEAGGTVRADIYDVRDRSAPALERTIRQDGLLAVSALQEGQLCLVSTCPAGEEALSFAPHVRDSLSGGDGALSEGQLVAEGDAASGWTVITLFNMQPDEQDEPPASLAVLGSAESLLLKNGRAYLAASEFGETVSSRIRCISLGDEGPRQVASIVLQGGLMLPRALIPLSDGLLAAAQGEGEALLYRLDDALSACSEILPQAKGQAEEE